MKKAMIGTGALALAAVVVILCLPCCRCTKPAEPASPSVRPADYMRDAEFRHSLSNQVAGRSEVAKARSAIAQRMEAMVDAVKAKIPNADDAAVRAELEKDPEWNSLYKRMLDANAAYEENRRKTTEIVRERITPKKAVSK